MDDEKDDFVRKMEEYFYILKQRKIDGRQLHVGHREQCETLQLIDALIK